MHPLRTHRDVPETRSRLDRRLEDVDFGGAAARRGGGAGSASRRRSDLGKEEDDDDAPALPRAVGVLRARVVRLLGARAPREALAREPAQVVVVVLVALGRVKLGQARRRVRLVGERADVARVVDVRPGAVERAAVAGATCRGRSGVSERTQGETVLNEVDVPRLLIIHAAGHKPVTCVSPGRDAAASERRGVSVVLSGCSRTTRRERRGRRTDLDVASHEAELVPRLQHAAEVAHVVRVLELLLGELDDEAAALGVDVARVVCDGGEREERMKRSERKERGREGRCVRTRRDPQKREGEGDARHSTSCVCQYQRLRGRRQHVRLERERECRERGTYSTASQ